MTWSGRRSLEERSIWRGSMRRAILRRLNSTDFTAYVNAELVKWADVVRKTGLEPN